MSRHVKMAGSMVEADLTSRFKAEMWSKIAEEMAIPWRTAEAMHWMIGEPDMAKRAGVTPFSLNPSSDYSRRITELTAGVPSYAPQQQIV